MPDVLSVSKQCQLWFKCHCHLSVCPPPEATALNVHDAICKNKLQTFPKMSLVCFTTSYPWQHFYVDSTLLDVYLVCGNHISCTSTLSCQLNWVLPPMFLKKPLGRTKMSLLILLLLSHLTAKLYNVSFIIVFLRLHLIWCVLQYFLIPLMWLLYSDVKVVLSNFANRNTPLLFSTKTKICQFSSNKQHLPNDGKLSYFVGLWRETMPLG